MKNLLFAFMLLASLQSIGQKKDSSSIRKIWSYVADSSKVSFRINNYQSNTISFMSNGITSAFLPKNSDTLQVLDSVIELYDRKIRYIKINGHVYPLKQ